MADVVIYGPSPSTYVRTARLACAEKGITHVLEPLDLGSEAHAKLHPFRKIPAMRHGKFVLIIRLFGMLFSQRFQPVNGLLSYFNRPLQITLLPQDRAQIEKRAGQMLLAVNLA